MAGRISSHRQRPLLNVRPDQRPDGGCNGREQLRERLEGRGDIRLGPEPVVVKGRGGPVEHYNTARPHQGTGQRIPGADPAPRVTAADLATWQIHRKPVLSGLINEYQRAA
jgi:hypothetical protein